MKLLIAMLVAIAVALGVFFGCYRLGNFLVWKYYLADEAKESRLEAYIEDLQQFATDNKISVNDTERFADWSGGKYVYAVLYKDSNLIYAPDWFDDFESDEGEKETDTLLGDEESSEQSAIEESEDVSEQITEQISEQMGGQVAEEGSERDEAGSDSDEPVSEETETETDKIPGPYDDRGFNKYLNEEIKQKYQETLNNILAGNAELIPITCTDGVLLATIVDYSEDFVYNIVFVISLICAIAVVGIIMFFNLSRLTSRVKKLAEKVRRVERGSINEPIRVSGNDEIASLADDVNSMRNSVVDNMTKEQQAWEANASLITAMSHDIRTPLTVLLGYLDLIEFQEENPANREYIGICKENALRLKGMSDDMFSYFLVFGKQGSISENIEKQNVDALKHIISERVYLLEENGYSFVWEGDIPDASVMVDTMFTNRVIDNIFSNVGKYATPGSTVIIRFDSNGKQLSVEFENEIRHDCSDAESNHIGLKTCSRIMEQMGGNFEAESDGERFCAKLTLLIAEND